MKRAFFGLAMLLALLCSARRASAVEGRGDVESDHVDAADDGGPRSAGFALDALSIATGWLGAELDAACGEHLVLGVEGDARWLWGLHGVRAVLGVAFFPQRFAFHGIYVHPRFTWNRVASAAALGGGITVGYAWTWPVGASLRLGGGIAYGKSIAGDGQVRIAFDRLGPMADADVGWVF
jgi:hypothetical protein